MTNAAENSGTNVAHCPLVSTRASRMRKIGAFSARFPWMRMRRTNPGCPPSPKPVLYVPRPVATYNINIICRTAKIPAVAAVMYGNDACITGLAPVLWINWLGPTLVQRPGMRHRATCEDRERNVPSQSGTPVSNACFARKQQPLIFQPTVSIPDWPVCLLRFLCRVFVSST